MSGARRMLRVVSLEPAAPLERFCGSCGEPPESPPSSGARVCTRCGMGVVLEARPSAVPGAGAPFLIVDRTLSVCGVSSAAEGLLAVSEPEAVNRHVTEFLVPADAEAPRGETVVETVLQAATDPNFEPRAVVLRPAQEFGVRFTARIARCGPPPAALVVLSDDAV